MRNTKVRSRTIIGIVSRILVMMYERRDMKKEEVGLLS
jgi:hypothetical protein